MSTLHSLVRLRLVAGVGNIIAKKLLSHFGSADEIFKSNAKNISKIGGITANVANNIFDNQYQVLAEKELTNMDKNRINAISIFDKEFPKRLIELYDAPFLLFTKGNVDLNANKMLSIVGTRQNTDYGKLMVEQIITSSQKFQVTIVSGLAYGIDQCAHKTALKHNLPTLGVLAHGLHRVYPAAHKGLAQDMLENGGLVSELTTNKGPEQAHFPMRNRIIAGLCDALIVVESGNKGGSLITATQANAYNKEVYAVPGRNTDSQSNGCNMLIRTFRAHLLENVEQVFDDLNWDKPKNNNVKQLFLFDDLNIEEQSVYNAFGTESILDIDTLLYRTKLSNGNLAMVLLELELKGYIQSLPGSRFQWK